MKLRIAIAVLLTLVPVISFAQPRMNGGHHRSQLSRGQTSHDHGSHTHDHAPHGHISQ